jgi:phosphoglycerol transferase MdoB-like AlkP superfamily enzyme
MGGLLCVFESLRSLGLLHPTEENAGTAFWIVTLIFPLAGLGADALFPVRLRTLPISVGCGALGVALILRSDKGDGMALVVYCGVIALLASALASACLWAWRRIGRRHSGLK